MGLQEWIASFRGLHERAKAGALDARGLENYQTAREELAVALLAAQRMVTRPGETARNTLRVARAVQVDIETAGEKHRAMTLDISVTGFSAMLGRPPDVGSDFQVTLRVPGGDPITTKARQTGVRRQGASWRISFNFEGMGAPEQERISFIVFDTALEQLKS